jgi:hypothetical protein
MNAHNSYKRDIYSITIRIAANICMIAALCLGMYQAGQHPDSSLLVFCQFFFPPTVLAWGLAIAATRALRRRYPLEADGATTIEIPRWGRKAVVWRIAEKADYARH